MTGETTKPIERSHVPTRDHLRASRGLKTLPTGQRFLEGFERLRALRGWHVHLADPSAVGVYCRAWRSLTVAQPNPLAARRPCATPHNVANSAVGFTPDGRRR